MTRGENSYANVILRILKNAPAAMTVVEIQEEMARIMGYEPSKRAIYNIISVLATGGAVKIDRGIGGDNRYITVSAEDES